jgi:NitT/TauT family transport system permease protein
MPENAEEIQPIRKVPLRGTGFDPGQLRAAPWIVFLVVFALWQWGCHVGYISPIILPSPHQIVMALWALVESGDLWRHVTSSLYRLVVGWSLGTLIGLAVGLSIGMFTLARSAGIPVIDALFPIPKIALLPLFIIWFGIGEPSKIATILFGVFFPTAINTYAGVDNVPRSLIRMGQSFGLSHWAVVRNIVLPGAMPGILAGFRISASIAIILLVAAEMIGAEYGIGALILSAGNLMQTDFLLAGVLLLSLLGLIVGFILTRIEKWVLRWR